MRYSHKLILQFPRRASVSHNISFVGADVTSRLAMDAAKYTFYSEFPKGAAGGGRALRRGALGAAAYYVRCVIGFHYFFRCKR